ncbi:MAG: AAA family ATPase [Deltaproteobacteria bacterium]|nr:AAA family ATPase [Deltaproteobacteria bacterium]
MTLRARGRDCFRRIVRRREAGQGPRRVRAIGLLQAGNVTRGYFRHRKTNFRQVRFAFVTGITRFAIASLDSGANNFKYISIGKRFAGIFQFQQQRVLRSFRRQVR